MADDTPQTPQTPQKQYIDLDGKPMTIGAPQQLTPQAIKQYITLQNQGTGSPDLTSGVPLQAPFVGRALVNQLPVAGAMASEALSGEPALGALGGTAAKDFLRSFQGLQPLIGRNPQDALGLAGDAIGDQLTNVALPKLISGIAGTSVPWLIAHTPLKNLPAVRQRVAQQIGSQMMDWMKPPTESGALEGAAQAAKGNQANLMTSIVAAKKGLSDSIQQVGSDIPERFAGYQAALDDLEKTFGKNQVGQQLVKLQDEINQGVDVAKSQTYRQIANTAMSDLSHVRNFKLATGSPEAIENLALNRLLTNGFKSTDGTFDAAKAIGELTGKNTEIWHEAIQPDTMGNLKNFLGAINDQQAGHGMSDRLIRYSQGHLIWSGLPMATGLATGHIGAGTLVSGAISSPLIANSMLSKLMANPETAKMVTLALKTSTLSPEGDFLEQSLRNAMRGLSAVATTPENQTPENQ